MPIMVDHVMSDSMVEESNYC